MSTTVTTEQVVDALGRSERYPAGSEGFNALAPEMGTLVEIVGDQANDKVGVGNMCDTVAKFVRHLATSKSFLDTLGEDEADLVSMLFGQLADQLEPLAQDPGSFLTMMGISEEQMMAQDSLGLSPEQLALYRAGKLTFEVLLTQSPEMFIPQPT